MSQTTQVVAVPAVEEKTLPPGPNLLIEWSSPWQDFSSSIGPAFSRSPAKLAGEAPFRMLPLRKIASVWVGECIFLFLMIWLPTHLERLRPLATQPAAHDVIYYSGDELPQTEDLGGAEAGTKGRAGGEEAHHRTQTIRIARGSSLVPKVVDAPNLKIPLSSAAVANLLAVRANAGPPPSEGLKSSRSAPSANAIIAPPPAVLKELTRSAPNLDAVVAPAPSVSADSARHTLTLDPALIAPAPTIARQHGRAAPALNTSVVAPANTDLSSRTQRTAPTVSTTIVPPSPSLSGSEIPRTPVQVVNSAVVPPPVSAPERESTRAAKLTLPAPNVIAPPPSPTAPDMRRMPSGGVPDPSKTEVQPPPSAPASGSFVSSLMGKIFGENQVVPPPPSVTGNGGGLETGRSPTGGNTVGAGNSVIAPPPSMSGGSGGSRSSGSLASDGASGVVQPPPSVSGAGAGRRGAGTAIATNVVAPPPALSGSAGGAGQGSRGAGLGSPLDAGSITAPPKSGGSGHDAGVVVTNQPGSKVGLPGASSGNLAMSPAGGDTPGLGGTGGGKGVVSGKGPGSGLTAEGPGAAKTGSGHGAEAEAHGGISPTPGPGGAGSATAGTPPVPGVSVSGGSTIVTLPSFGGTSSNTSSGTPGRSSLKTNQGFDVSVIGTSRSGGAFNYYGLLPGDATSVYLQTPLGPATFQYAETTQAARNNAPALVNPQLLHADALSGVTTPRITVTCTLDIYGSLKNLKILDSDHAASVPKVMAALAKWKFRPAMRGDQPVEVVAILGFGTDTNDRY